MGGASSTQRGGKVAQVHTVLQEVKNANEPKDTAQAANIAKDHLIYPNTEQEPQKGDAKPAIPYTDTTNRAMNFPDGAASMLTCSTHGVPNVNLPRFTNVVAPSETRPRLDVVISQQVKDAPNNALQRTQMRDPKIGIQSKKRTRRVRVKGKGAEALQEGAENIPPPLAAQQNTLSGRRRGPSRGENRTRPGPRRGRATNSTTAQVADDDSSRSAEGVVEGDVKDGGCHARINGTRDGGRKGNSRPRRRLPSQGGARKNSGSGLGMVEEEMELPKADRESDDKSADRRLSEGEGDRRSIPGPHESATASSPCEDTEPVAEGDDASTAQPLPSSARRRAKEYIQRRTRERSVDAARRHIANPRAQLDLPEGPVAKASGGTSASMSDAKQPDQFAFDPEASPFTPNATSSPRQASVSSIGVQSFSSPTPLPSHGNRKVAPLILPKGPNKGTRSEPARRDLVPATLAYPYAGANSSHAEQIALVRLQAYYNWLAGSIPATGVGIGLSAWEHMDMSGGSGGLSGGVALGRLSQSQSLSQGRGKGQCRKSSGAYAHPKEHVVFSPREHEGTEVGSESALPQGSGTVKAGEDEKGKERGKWDGKWGLREVTGKEIGWSWGQGDSSGG
ncbi:hypothetical protein F5148DRAFT_1157210 [Russula earlei]|uniref:Uncharacterized protein n=1 Tax=Russula earlei TaxID=71964 RepID=A0ACC0UP24_9AGAM|nr:hypothetical protein F5148DRAFT_1157210 [Russula earlei]